MRWIIRIIVAFVLVAIVAVGMLFLLPTERIGQIASDQLEKATGRKLSLSGNFSPTLYPVLGVKTGRITISNADWAQEPVMIEAAGAAVGVNLSALLGGNLEVSKLRLLDPVIHLERAKDGRVNWEFSGTGASVSGGGDNKTPEISLARGEISNGSITYLDRQAGDVISLSNIELLAAMPKGSSRLTLDGEAVWQGQKAILTGNIADIHKLLADGVTAIDLNAELAGAKLGLNGNIGIGGSFPVVEGRVSLAIADISKLQKQLGVNQAIPLKINSFTSDGQLQLSAAGLYFSGDLSTQLNDLPLTATVEITGEEDWMNALAFDLAMNVKGAETLALQFDGSVKGLKQSALGFLDLKSGNPRALLQALNLSADLPKGTFQSLAIKGKLRVKPSGEMVLKKATLSMDQNLLRGRVSVVTKGKPFITATLSAKKLDFSKFTSEESSGGGSGATTTGWSKEPIGLSGLDAVNADVTLKAKSLNLGVSQLGKTHINAKLRDGLLTLKLVDVRAYKGAMSGTVVVRGGKGIAFNSDVVAKDMQLKPLLGQLLDIDRVIGTGTTKLKLSGRGASLHGVMNSLSGTGNIKFTNGAFRGIDLAAMMRNLKSAFGGFDGATEFSSMTGSFLLNKGVLENVDLSLVSPLFRAAGKGKVGIGGQFMDYVVTPSTLNGNAKISVPIFITGPWDNLKFRPDLDKLLDLVLKGKLEENEKVIKAKKKLKKLKAKLRDPKASAKEKLRKKLAKKLKVAEPSEKALKNSIEDKIEDEIGNALKKLFD